MKDSIKKGVSFGITSGIITTLGLIIGLEAGTHSKLIIISGILTIAFADAFSDSLGVHILEESGKYGKKKKNYGEQHLQLFFLRLFSRSLF